MEIQNPPLDYLLAEHANLDLHISHEEDIRIRSLDVVGKEDTLSDEDEKHLAQNLLRFFLLHERHQSFRPDYSHPYDIEFDPNSQLAQFYFSKIQSIGQKHGLSIEDLCDGKELPNPQDQEAIILECFRIARDAMLVLGETKYNTTTKNLPGAFTREVDPDYLMSDIPEDVTDFYMESMENSWKQCPVAWARDCYLLAIFPNVAEGIANHEREKDEKKRSVLQFAEMWNMPIPAKELKEESSNPNLNGISQDSMQTINQLYTALQSAKKSPLNRYTKITYKPVQDQSHMSRKGPSNRFLGALISLIPDNQRDKLQFKIMKAAEEVALMQKEKLSDEKKRKPHLKTESEKELDLILDAATSFRQLAFMRNPFRLTHKNGNTYILRPDITNPEKWQINIIQNDELIYSELEEVALQQDSPLTQEDIAAFESLSIEREKHHDSIIESFEIKVKGRMPGKRLPETGHATQIVYVLAHSLCRYIADNISQPLSVDHVQQTTTNSIQEALDS